MGWICSAMICPSTELWLWLAFAAVASGLLSVAHTALAGPLSGIPTIHWLARWSRFYNLYIKYFHSTRTVHYEAHISRSIPGDYHPILRVSPNEVSIMTTEGIKAVWGADFERSPWYDVFANFGKPNMFSSTSSRAHSSRKRVFASAYSKTAITQDRVQNIINSRLAKLVGFVGRQTSSDETFSGTGGPVVIRNVLRALQADIFTAFAFADKAGTTFLDNLKKGPNTLEDLGMTAMDLFHDEKRDEFFFWESEKPFKYFASLLARSGLKSHETAQRWLMDLIKPYEARTRSKKSIQSSEKSIKHFNCSVYDKLLLYKNPKTGKPLDWTERASEIMDHAVAGQDAVPAALEFIFRQISTHPDVQSKMRLELLTSLPLSAQDRTFAMIDSLSYVNAVVMEGLRLVDTISSYQTRVVPKGGCVISGYHLPAGTIVAAQPHLINRQPDIFPDPNMFNPSRWLLPREEYRNLAKSMWTYSSGPRSCLGRELSLAIIKTVLVDIYIRYKTTLLEENRAQRRTWEGADSMAEVCFENVLACEDGEWIERRMLQPSLDPASAQRQIEEPVRRRSIFELGFGSFKSMPAGDNDCQEALTSPTHRPLAARPEFNTDPFAKAKETTEPRQAHRSLDPLVEDSEKIAPDETLPNGEQTPGNVPHHQHMNAQAWLGHLNTIREPSLVPALLDPSMDAQGQKGGEQREEISRRPSMMLMGEEDGVPPLEKSVVRAARSRRPMLKHRSTAPERVDGVLQGS